MVSAVVLTHNEEENITSCLEKLKWCSEIIIVDDNSTDKTTPIAKTFGAKILSRPLDGDFAAQRNFALNEVTQKWILFVDADEHISYDLRVEILKSTKDISYKAFIIPRVDFFFGHKMRFGDVRGAKFVRLVRRGTGKWAGPIHEVWISDGRVGELKNPIKHYPHRTIVDFLRSINYYSTVRARELHAAGKKSSALEIVAYPIGKFVLDWFLRLGFLDGTHGTIHALMMSFYSFLVRAKLYLLWKNISGKLYTD